MTQQTEPTDFKALKECLRQPLFYLALAFMLLWGIIQSPWPFILTLPFAFVLTCLTFIDSKHMILPDLVTIPMTFIALLFHFILSDSIIIPLLGAVIGFILFFFIFYISYKIKGTPSLGFGDVKLLTMLGATVGISGLPLVLIYSSLFALTFISAKILYRKKFSNTPFPYGPFLCLGGWLTFLYHDITWTVILNIRENILTTILG